MRQCMPIEGSWLLERKYWTAGTLAYNANVSVSRASRIQQGSNRCGIEQQENAKSAAAGACGARSMSLLCCLRDVFVSWLLCITSRTCPVYSEQSDTIVRVQYARDHLPCCLFGATELKAEARVGRVQSRASVCGDPRIRVDIQNGVAVSPCRQLHTPTFIATEELITMLDRTRKCPVSTLRHSLHRKTTMG
jgi:hypothetical protein